MGTCYINLLAKEENKEIGVEWEQAWITQKIDMICQILINNWEDMLLNWVNFLNNLVLKIKKVLIDLEEINSCMITDHNKLIVYSKHWIKV